MKKVFNVPFKIVAAWILTVGTVVAIDDIDFGYGSGSERVAGSGIAAIQLDKDNRADYIMCYSHHIKINLGSVQKVALSAPYPKTLISTTMGLQSTPNIIIWVAGVSLLMEWVLQ